MIKSKYTVHVKSQEASSGVRVLGRLKASDMVWQLLFFYNSLLRNTNKVTFLYIFYQNHVLKFCDYYLKKQDS